jgi:hypothetical protein
MGEIKNERNFCGDCGGPFSEHVTGGADDCIRFLRERLAALTLRVEAVEASEKLPFACPNSCSHGSKDECIESLERRLNDLSLRVEALEESEAGEIAANNVRSG